MRHFYSRFLSPVVALFLLSSAASASESAFVWEGHLDFDPARVVGIDGSSLASLFESLGFVNAATGQVPISGTFRYEPTTPATTANTLAAGHANAVLSATVSLAGRQSVADRDLIAANARSSYVYTITWPGGGFCGDHDHCQQMGVPQDGWGNQVVLLNDTPHILLDETGANPKAGDAFGLMIGRTEARGEFTPALFPKSGAPVFVDGLSVLMFSKPDVQMMDRLAIPRIEDIDFDTTVGRTEIWIFLEGPGLPGTIRVEGVLTGVRALP